MKKVTTLRIWIDFEYKDKVHNWYWDKRFDDYTTKPVFSDQDVLDYTKKYFKLDVSHMIDEVNNFGNPEYDFEGFDECIEHKYKLKINPNKLNGDDANQVLLAMYGVKTKKLNQKKVSWHLLDENYSSDYVINPSEFSFPKDMLDYLDNSSNLFKSISGGLEGPTMVELWSSTNLQLIDVEFSADDEHIKISKSFFNNDPNKGDEEKMYRFKAIDLIRENDLYESEGLLIWIPELKIFGSFDTEHKNLVVFPDAKAKNIQKNFGKYIMAQWSYGKNYLIKCGNIYDYFEPWKYFKFE